MIIDKSIKRVTVGNTDIQRIMHGGGILWQKNTVPGPTKLIGGNLQAGFYGEVPAKDFITGDELARRIGLTAGVSQYSGEPWLKFSYLGKVEFVAKKPFRYSISWNNINDANAVYGNKTMDINGKKYKIRLMKADSEWDKLIVPLCSTWNLGYTDGVLITNVNYGNGSRALCQELNGTELAYYRGQYGFRKKDTCGTKLAVASCGWRPVLELIKE
ncbi:hypothetical protein [Peptoniphilus duerdenii]|uniref:hypothetical protein n=1 Tax=Peptoniphilus duerdenii TaxID=507750 RepID=UPI00288A0879|nr:hypothetical protein [Peptoniphilus duerdenii]